MIEFIRIRNFKSLGEVPLRLSKFNCLIGMNGAGKSTVLQAFDFISQLMRGDVKAWLDGRGWSIADLNCKLRKESNIALGVEFRTSSGALLTWVCSFNRASLRCTSETITIGNEKAMRSDGQSFNFGGKTHQDIAFTYQGSLLSALKDTELPGPILEFREALRRIRSLELLSPQLLRKRARISDHDIGVGGEKLSAYLDNIKGERKVALIALLKKFYPSLIDFKVATLRSGWKQLSVFEQYGEHKLETEAAHLNDGLLRILAVLTQASSDRSLILLDEIENGINQEIVEALVDTLVASPQQMLVTTHSPLILNYLDDEVARQAVQFIYKTPQGESRIRPFFEIPRIGEKLRSMGPGDAFVDTDLKALTQECIALDPQGDGAGVGATA
ncbi:MAG: AAA family ATPase [Gallionella sp.]|nr:AAA family ATPase [Gallionella sp.]